MVPSMRIGLKRFASICGPLDRAVYLTSRPSNNDFLRVMENLRSKSTTDIGRINPQLVFRQTQYKSTHQQTDHMWILTRGMQGELTGRLIIITDCAPGFDRVRDQAIVYQIQSGYMVSIGKCFLNCILVTQSPVITDICSDIIVNASRAIGYRSLHVNHCIEHIIIDKDALSRISRLSARLCQHDSNRVTYMTNLALRQHWMFRFRHCRTILAVDLPSAGNASDFGHILRCENSNHALACSCRGCID